MVDSPLLPWTTQRPPAPIWIHVPSTNSISLHRIEVNPLGCIARCLAKRTTRRKIIRFGIKMSKWIRYEEEKDVFSLPFAHHLFLPLAHFSSFARVLYIGFSFHVQIPPSPPPPIAYLSPSPPSSISTHFPPPPLENYVTCNNFWACLKVKSKLTNKIKPIANVFVMKR